MIVSFLKESMLMYKVEFCLKFVVLFSHPTNFLTCFKAGSIQFLLGILKQSNQPKQNTKCRYYRLLIVFVFLVDILTE